ncbi:M23/M56 family metallopeptidase [Janthinobacterium sp.]|uniref:M23/M56 family metallopeptidase n=1 Tax=Janthinobacterium sp. TaxID=1871054 RepID=UPI002619E422|nr:M23/M56 family metallopeptidase [Janthinobacterium sp.]
MTLFALTLLRATLACLLTGLLLQGLLHLAQRRWPVLSAQRGVWLGAQLLLAFVFILSLLPPGQRISVVPDVSLPMATTSVQVLPLPQETAAGELALPLEASSGVASNALLLKRLALAWLLVYPCGVAYMAWRYRRNQAIVMALLKAARPLDLAAMQAHGAFTEMQLRQLQQQRMEVLEIDAPISPMLLGSLQPRLLLPAHLAQFTPEQQQLIIEHELTHSRRRDPAVQLLANCLHALLWFNPALRRLGQKLGWAQELGCDRQVLAGRPLQQRQQYAAALVRQLSVQSCVPAGLAFGGKPGGMADRVARMRDTQSGSMPWGVKLALVTVLGALGASSVVLQPALAWVPAEAASATVAATAIPDTAPWRNPLASMRVTGFFGVVRPTTPKGLSGLDLAASRGTPVHAVADGVARVAHDDSMGNLVRIDHGAGLESWYVHLDSVALADGAIVKAGQTIGTVGATGRAATGPHLHFQVRQDGKRQDPQTRLAGLDANASERALRMRREQFGR